MTHFLTIFEQGECIWPSDAKPQNFHPRKESNNFPRIQPKQISEVIGNVIATHKLD
jgi:hypothetical protein